METATCDTLHPLYSYLNQGAHCRQPPIQRVPRQCNEWSIDDTTLTPSNRRGVTHYPQLITFVSGSPPVRRPQVLLLLHYVLCSLFPCCVVAAQQGRSTRKSFCEIDKEFELMTKTIKKNFVQVSSFMVFMRGPRRHRPPPRHVLTLMPACYLKVSSLL
jgi:hypothetical protein